MKKKEFYSRLEIFCSFGLQPQSNFYIRDNPDFGGEVYVEEYNSFDSVKNRILELSEQWTNKYYSTNIFTSKEEDKIYDNGGIDYNHMYKYPIFLLYNNYSEEFLQVGYCPVGWLAPLQFIIYLYKFYTSIDEKKQDKDKIAQINLKLSKERNLVFLCPEWYTVPPSDLILEETSDLYIKEWLDKGEVSLQYQQIIFQKEIERINNLFTKDSL